MAFSPEELQIIQYGKANKKSREETLKALEKFRTSNTASATATATVPPAQPSTVQSRLADVGIGKASKIQDAIAGEGQYEGQSALTRGIGATATAFSTVPEAAVALTPEPVRKTVDAVQGGVSKAFKALTDLIGSNKDLQAWTQAHPDATNAIMEVAQGASDLGVISGNILGAKGASTAVQAGTQGTKAVAGAVSRSTQKLVDGSTSLMKSSNVVSNLVSPKKDVVGAVGEVLQGKPKDVPKGVEAFKAIDTTGVKTYAELGTRIDKSITDLSDIVDQELSKDLTRTPLSELRTSLKTKSGNTVSTNYVKTALEQLKELYEKTGDVQKAADIDELLVSSQANGLTKLEVNDIARVYNSEFGSKAFSPATGEALTSVNAQLYETIRKGIKGKAREGIGGDEAKAADQTISALYNTKTLVQKNTEAVNKLQQKIADRGIFEKAGYLVSKYADILTGGSIRGFIGGILPRGAGYKTLNAIDLEARLQRNLEIIDKASKASTDAEMAKILTELEQ